MNISTDTKALYFVFVGASATPILLNINEVRLNGGIECSGLLKENALIGDNHPLVRKGRHYAGSSDVGGPALTAGISSDYRWADFNGGY